MSPLSFFSFLKFSYRSPFSLYFEVFFFSPGFLLVSIGQIFRDLFVCILSSFSLSSYPHFPYILIFFPFFRIFSGFQESEFRDLFVSPLSSFSFSSYPHFLYFFSFSLLSAHPYCISHPVALLPISLSLLPSAARVISSSKHLEFDPSLFWSPPIPSVPWIAVPAVLPMSRWLRRAGSFPIFTHKILLLCCRKETRDFLTT